MAHTHTDILITILKTSAHTLFSHPMIEGLGTGDWGLGIEGVGIGISSSYKAIWNLNCHYVFLDIMFRHTLDIISIKKIFSPCNPKARRKIKKKFGRTGINYRMR